MTVGDNPDTLNLNLEGQKTITINVKKHYENMKENEQGTDLYTLADDFLNGDVYKSGDVFGTTSDWGLWDIECSKLKGSDCIRVGLGIQSLKGGKLDILGTMDIYFDYDENGQIRVLKSDFSQMQD